MSIEKKHQPLEFICKPNQIEGAWDVVFDASNKENSLKIREHIDEGRQLDFKSYPIEVFEEIVDFLRGEGEINLSMETDISKQERQSPASKNVLSDSPLIKAPVVAGISDRERVELGSSLSFPTVIKNSTVSKVDMQPLTSLSALIQSPTDQTTSYDPSSLIRDESYYEGQQADPFSNDAFKDEFESDISSELEAELKSRTVIRAKDMKDPIRGGDVLRAQMVPAEKKIKRAEE